QFRGEVGVPRFAGWGWGPFSSRCRSRACSSCSLIGPFSRALGPYPKSPNRRKENSGVKGISIVSEVSGFSLSIHNHSLPRARAFLQISGGVFLVVDGKRKITDFTSFTDDRRASRRPQSDPAAIALPWRTRLDAYC